METSTSDITAASLGDQLLRQLDSVSPLHDQFPIALSVSAAGICPWSWLDANAGSTRIAWSERDSDVISAGIGCAADISLPAHGDPADCFRTCRQLLGHNQTLRCFGGFSFDGSDGWRSFGAGRFVIPRLIFADDQMTLAVMDADDLDSARAAVRELCIPRSSFDDRLPVPIEKSHQPTFDGWQSRIDEALSLIRAEALEKIVLSRKTRLRFESAPNPIALTSHLEKATHDCFVF
ncbi:MAG: hypothetical protein AAFP90_03910, partial [Planctomycetota bacterium]